ncbi:hypothetical protein [Rhizorhabdus histidinilytica]|uniref:hypothetical protein n=1 Tax=Rhizorhabdus histidinilytica TaxID=439228 RepID=UPI000B13D446|nr:hypothetical protein [Sphingomonas sp. Y57]
MARNDGFADLVLDANALRDARERVETGTYRAARGAVASTTKDAERALEAATRHLVGGNLWRAWNSKIYPESGRASNNPTGFIYPKGAKGGRTEGAIRSLVEGGRIRGKDGGLMAVALPVVGRRGWSGGRGNWTDMSPKEWLARNPGYKLEPIWTRDGRGFLVAKANINSQGRVRRATARQIETEMHATVLVFALLPAVNARGGLSIEGTVKPFEARLLKNFEQEARQSLRGDVI